MEQTDHTIVQDSRAQELAQELSLQAQPTPAEGAPDLPGYLLRHRLGRGSFGEVWDAVQTRSGQSVAVKVFTQSKGLDFRYLQHEIKRLRQVSEHPHIVTLLDADFQHDPPFFAMGLYQTSLSTWRQEKGEVPLDLVVEWMQQIAQALKFTHDKGLLHCDLKPANVLLDAERRVKVADFGQAVERGLPGSSVGSLGYMAPEQASLDSSSPDVRWDIYGLGATVYYLLTGVPPRMSDQTRETMGSITDPTERLERYREVLAASPLVPLRNFNAQIDADLDRLVTSCLSLDPAARPQNMSELLEDLTRRQDYRPLLCQKPWGTWYRARRFARRHALGLALVAVVMGSGVAATTEFVHRASAQRQAMALREFEMGWQAAKEGRTAEAGLWWAKSLDTNSDNLPARAALDSISFKLKGELVHGEDAVTTVACSPDGKWMASADAKGLLRVWQDGKVVADIKGLRPASSDVYSAAPPQFAFTPDGRHLLTTIGLFGLGQETPLVPFDGSVAIDPEGRGAVITTSLGAKSFDSETHKMSALPRSLPVEAVAFGSNQGDFAILGEDGSVDLYAKGKLVGKALHKGVGAIAYSPDGRLLVTCSDDRTAKIWDAQTGTLENSLDHGWRVTSARFTADDSKLVTTSYNGDVRMWDVASGLSIMHEPMHHAWFAYGTVPDSSGKLFASYGVDGQARVWRANGTPLSPWFNHGSAIRDAAFIEGQNRLVTAGGNGTLRLWELGEERKTLASVPLGDEVEIFSVAIDPKGELFSASWQGFPEGGGAVLGVKNNTTQQWPLGPPGVRSKEVLFSPDGEQIAVASDDGQARVYDRGGQLIRTVAHQAAVVSLGFTPDGKTLMSADRDGTINLSGGVSQVFQLKDALTNAKLSPDGRLVAAVGSDGEAAVWDVQGGQEIFQYRHDAPLRRVVIDDQSGQLLLCGQDGKARLVNLKTLAAQVFSHNLMVTNGNFDHTGERVLTTSLSGEVKVWNTKSGVQLPSPQGHGGPILVGEFSPDDSLILTVSKDGKAQVWETASGLPVGLPIRHQRIAYDGAFSADGKSVVTGGHDGVLKFTAVGSQDEAFIPSTRELEATVGSRLAEKEGKVVCETVARHSQQEEVAP